MVEPTRRHVDRGVEESMSLFQRAKVGRIGPVAGRRPRRVLLVLDGSTQDPLAAALARDLQRRFGTALAVLDAREGAPPDGLAEQFAQSLHGRVLKPGRGSSYDQILDAIQASDPELVIVPCPYQRDLESVGPDSAGTVIDVLVARSPVPLLVLRQPLGGEIAWFGRLRIVFPSENEAAPAAASWAVGLVRPGGSIRLVLILSEEFHENLKAVMQSVAPEVEVDEEALSNALAAAHLRLHRGLQKAAEAGDFSYQLEVHRAGTSLGALPPEGGAPPILVLPLERADHASRGFVQAEIRLSPYPLVVVPTQRASAPVAR